MSEIYFFILLNTIISVMLGLTPYINRKNLPFGVSLEEEKETVSEIRGAKKSYLIINIGVGVLLSTILILANSLNKQMTEEQLVYLSLVSLFVILLVSLITYVTRHKQLKKLKQSLPKLEKQTQKLVIDLSFRDEKLIFPTSYLVGFNAVFILLTVVLTVMNYDKIPNTIVMQWDFNMNPTTVTDKTWLSVMSIPLIQVFITVVMAISNHSYLSAKQQIDMNNPEQSVIKNKRFRRQSSLLNFIISIMTQILMTSIQLVIVFNSISPKVIMVLSLVFTVLILGLTLWYSLYYGQSGSRLKDTSQGDLGHNEKDILYRENYELDEHWKLGMFYVNKEDPAFWVEKRMGIGMTFNFAKWQAWVFLLSLVLIPIAIVLLTT